MGISYAAIYIRYMSIIEQTINNNTHCEKRWKELKVFSYHLMLILNIIAKNVLTNDNLDFFNARNFKKLHNKVLINQINGGMKITIF